MTIRKSGLQLFALPLIALCQPAIAGSSPQQARFDALAARAKGEMLTDPRTAVATGKAGERIAAAIMETKARQTAIATARWLQAEALDRMGEIDRAAPLAASALKIIQAVGANGKLKGDLLVTSGSIHGSRSDVAASLADFQAAHRIFVRIGDRRSQAISLICIAMLYVDARDFASALRYLDQALEAYPADPSLAYAIYNSRGLAYQEQGRYDKADGEFQRALRFARRAHATSNAAKYLRNIARNDLRAGRLAEADRTISTARSMVRTSPEDGKLLDAIAAQAALQHGQLQGAERLVDRAFADIDLTRTDLPFRDSHQTAVAVYQARKRPDLALAHLQALKRLDDQATRLATQTNTALMAARFDSANQDAKIARLRDAARLREAREEVQRARAERTLWLGASGATAVIMVLLLIGIAAIRRSRDQVSAANADLATTNSALGKALAAKTEFLATTSHEIRTPLNGILGMTQVMLADAALAPQARDRLTVVHGAGMTMRALVDDILDVAKMETGNLGLETAPFDLAAMLGEASRMWADQAGAKGLAFTVDLAHCPARVEGDAARVRQIVFNLLSNALKFTAEGAIGLRAESDRHGIRISVTDTGIGIAPAQHEAVFEFFRQADTSTTRRFGGTGLGLSICRNLARAMGGDVTLESRAGEGTTFTVALPLPVLPAPAPVCAAPDGGATLLVIDRNPIARAMFRTLFAPHVGLVAFAASVEEAAPCLASGNVAQVLIDDATARAGGDAPAFIAAVAERAGGARLVLLAAAGEDRDPPGVDAVIVKPIAGAALVAALFGGEDGAMRKTPLVSRAA